MRKKNKSPVSCIMLWYDGIVFTPLLGRRRTVGGGRRALGGRWAGIHPPPSSSTPTIDDIIERVIWYLRHVDARFPPRPLKLGFVQFCAALRLSLEGARAIVIFSAPPLNRQPIIF
jgi:hypothetical protein